MTPRKPACLSNTKCIRAPDSPRSEPSQQGTPRRAGVGVVVIVIVVIVVVVVAVVVFVLVVVIVVVVIVIVRNSIQFFSAK